VECCWDFPAARRERLAHAANDLIESLAGGPAGS
jgi:hypothetical protein